MSPNARHRWGMALILIVLGLNLVRSLQLYDGYLGDPFHHGEFFAAFETLLRREPGFYPITIHGVLDYLPALISYRFFGEDHYFFFASLLHQSADILAALVFFLLVFSFLKDNPKNKVPLLATALVAPYLVVHKDLLLVIGIFLYFSIQKTPNIAVRRFEEILFGAVIAFGMFWSFDRGIAGVASLGLGCLIQAVRSKRYVLSLAAFCVSVLLLGLIGPEFSLANYWKNVVFLLDTSSQWSYGLYVHAVRLTILLAAANVLVICIFLFNVEKKSLSAQGWANYLALLVLSVCLFKMGTNRADAPHVLSAAWGPLLFCLYWRIQNPTAKLHVALKIGFTVFLVLMLIASRRYRDMGFMLMAVALYFSTFAADFSGRFFRYVGYATTALLLVPLYTLLNNAYLSRSNGAYKWVKFIGAEPSNTTVTFGDVQWAATELVKSGTQCLFDFSNSGVINGLARLPNCTQVTYPVYANRKYEPQMIEDLKKTRPKAIVYSSTAWHFAIDGKTMPTRFPDLAQYLQSEYTNEQCSPQYCIRYIRN